MTSLHRIQFRNFTFGELRKIIFELFFLDGQNNSQCYKTKKQEPRKRFYFLVSCSSCLIYIIWYFSAKKINHHFYHKHFIYINRTFICIILQNSEYHKNGSTFLLHLKAVTANILTSKNGWLNFLKFFQVKY